jgi:formamidopyrimidine-DNA glycosylase
MPELPDVEGFRRYLSRHASGKRVRGVRVPAPDILRNTSPQGLSRALKGRTLEKPERLGKWLFVAAGESTLILHFGMTGGLRWTSSPDRVGRFDRLVLELDGGELAYHNMRKLGGAWLARSASAIERVTGSLGPDAADVGGEEFEHMLRGRRGGIKAALMNQRMIAGIGNELSDEILWQARVRPSRRVSSLRRRERDALFESMQEVLTESMRHGRIPRLVGWLTSQRGVRDPTCPRCGGALKRTTIAGRTSYWCPSCQPARP